MEFVIDRTVEDVMYAQSLVTAIWSKMENSQREEWLKGIDTPLEPQSLKGFFNYTDMQRIKFNYNTLGNMWSYGGDRITNTYEMSTMPNRTTMSADFEKIREFGRDYLPIFVKASYSDYRTPKQILSNVNKMDYIFLNNYEHILKNLNDLYLNNELDIKCEFLPIINGIELDGYLKGFTGHKIEITIPSGYLATRQSGNMSGDDFVVGTSTVYKTSGEIEEQYFSTTNPYANLIIESGVQHNDIVMPYRINPTSYDVTNFDTVILDCDLLLYDTTTNYTASAIQSDLIDVTDKVSLYLYNSSDYSGNIIITTYDENQDVIDEFALTSDMQIDLTNVGYFTIDSEVGDTLTYLLSSGSSIEPDGLRVITDVIHSYTIGDEFDVRGIDTLKIRSRVTTANQIVLKATKFINGGKDISQLDTEEIKVKYV